jgi:serine/threonine protein kinase/Flp pilus assembly protein TadD
MRPDHRGRGADPRASLPADSPGLQDDPRVASALAAYLAELEAGRRPPREELLGCNPEIAGALADCLDVVEFVHSAARGGSSSGPFPPVRETLPPDTVVGEYRLVREIGRGGMGVVYEAEQVSLGRRVALKVLSGTAALDPLKLQRFRIETQAVAQLHHPHIVPIFAVGSERGSHHYAMQYIEGGTLADVIHQQRQLGRVAAGEPEGGPISSVAGSITPIRAPTPSGCPTGGTGDGVHELARSGLVPSVTRSLRGRGAFRALARLAIQAAEALGHAHAMGILHRDIKPSNLLVDSRGNLWVTDFGLARFQDEPGLTRTGDLLGTLRYMAPELVLGHRLVHDPRSDLYSLGATLYELLTLRPVFDGRDRQVLLRKIAQEEPILPRRINPTIPRDLETIVLKAMDKEPDRRYATASELAEDLHRFLEDRTIRARRPTPVKRVAKWARRHRAVLGTAATVAFLALAIAAPLLWWQQRDTARKNEDLRAAFEQVEQMIPLADQLTVKGMARYAESGQDPGMDAIRVGFFRQAVEFYDRLVQEPHIARPMKALAYRRLGLSRMLGMNDPRAEGDFRHALTLYEELLAGSPGDPELRDAIADIQWNLGIALMASRGMAAAEPAFHRATSLHEELASEFPDDLRHLDLLTGRRLQLAAWMETSRLQAQAEQERRQLLAFYEKLATKSPGRSQAMAASYRRLASALREPGQRREQRDALRRALKLRPDDPTVLNDLAWSLTLPSEASPGESAEAVGLAKRAVAANPKEGAFWNTLGLAHLRAGQLPLAAEALTKSIELQSQGGEASDRLLMAMVCWRRGDKQQALDWYIRALDWLSRNPESDASLLALRSETERLLGRSPAGPSGTAAGSQSGSQPPAPNS